MVTFEEPVVGLKVPFIGSTPDPVDEY